MERYDYQQQENEQEAQWERDRELLRETAQFALDMADDNELLAQWAELTRGGLT